MDIQSQNTAATGWGLNRVEGIGTGWSTGTKTPLHLKNKFWCPIVH